MASISVALATFNEEENVKRALESVAAFASEIVAVDGRSTDKTVEILKKYGVKVTAALNPANFHINKNMAIDRCKSDWILQLDADEVVTPELKKEILKAVNLNSENQLSVNGYWIPRKNMFLGKFLKKGGQYPDYTLRLYRRGKGRLPAKSVHEQAVVEGKTAYLKNPLLHFPYPDFSHYLVRFKIYTDFFAGELRAANLPVNLLSFTDYVFIKPLFWFLSTFIRHKGFYDGFAGFVFSFFSALRFPIAFLKYLKRVKSS